MTSPSPLTRALELRTFVRRLLLAEILVPFGRPGPLEPPPAAGRRVLRNGPRTWLRTRVVPRGGRR